MSVTTFETFSEQAEAKRLLAAALIEGPAHAYLFHGPQGVGKRDFARAFAREILATTRAVHPDLYELEALGEMIRIDAIRELRRDLHMRPFETDRRVYLRGWCYGTDPVLVAEHPEMWRSPAMESVSAEALRVAGIGMRSSLGLRP